MRTIATDPRDGRLVADRDDDATARAAAQDPADIILRREERVVRLKAALNGMSDIEQQVLVGHESLGTPLGRLARALGITDADAAAHLARARAALARHDRP